MSVMARIRHRFVECIPEEIEEGTLYISVEYTTAVHKCCCGCGSEVVTPLSPTDWKLSFDGETISLDPSIGNWGMDCKSHYWIEDSVVRWVPRWSEEQIEEGRARDRWAKRRYFEDRKGKVEGTTPASATSLVSHGEAGQTPKVNGGERKAVRRKGGVAAALGFVKKRLRK